MILSALNLPQVLNAWYRLDILHLSCEPGSDYHDGVTKLDAAYVISISDKSHARKPALVCIYHSKERLTLSVLDGKILLFIPLNYSIVM